MADVAAFTLDVALPRDAKAVHEGQDGDLIIEGFASDFNVDREDEMFEAGAFSKGVREFLDGAAPLLYHHHNDQQLGQVLELDPRPEGLWMKAVVAKPAESSPLLDVYNKIQRGMMKGLSVRGFFKRREGAKPARIYHADLAEISVTPFPVNPRTLFAVGQKAFEPEPTDEELAALRAHLQTRYDESEKLLAAAGTSVATLSEDA